MTQPEQASDAEKAFGAAVRERRTLLGLTQDQVRRRLLDSNGIDLSKTAMSRLEQGERPIRFNEVTALSQLLEIDLRMFSRTSSTRSEAEELDMALAIATERLAAVDAEFAAASEAATGARLALQDAEKRLDMLRSRREEMRHMRNELAHSLHSVADARKRFELMMDGHGEH